jgi:hypothetical protein
VEPPEPIPEGGLTIGHMQDEMLKLAPRKGDGPFVLDNPADPHEISGVDVVPPSDGTLTAAADDRPARTVAVLEQWLDAIHVSRQGRHS